MPSSCEIATCLKPDWHISATNPRIIYSRLLLFGSLSLLWFSFHQSTNVQGVRREGLDMDFIATRWNQLLCIQTCNGAARGILLWEQSSFSWNWLSASMLSADLTVLSPPPCRSSSISPIEAKSRPTETTTSPGEGGKEGRWGRKMSMGMGRRREIEREKGARLALCLNLCRQQTGLVLCHLFADLPVPSTGFHLASFPPNFPCAAPLTCICPFLSLRFSASSAALSCFKFTLQFGVTLSTLTL